MNHAESPKVCEKVLEFFKFISPIIVKFSEICRKTPFLRICDELFTLWSLLFRILPFLDKRRESCRQMKDCYLSSIELTSGRVAMWVKCLALSIIASY